MLYFLNETVRNHEWHIHKFCIQFSFICSNGVNINSDCPSDGFNTLPPLTLPSFETRVNHGSRMSAFCFGARKGHVKLYRCLDTHST